MPQNVSGRCYKVQGSTELRRLDKRGQEMKTIQSINWLIEQYRQNIEKLEEDRKQDTMTISNAYRVAKIGVYSKVVEDLQAVLEEGDVE